MPVFCINFFLMLYYLVVVKLLLVTVSNSRSCTVQGPPGPEGEPGLQGEPGTKVNVKIILSCAV